MLCHITHQITTQHPHPTFLCCATSHTRLPRSTPTQLLCCATSHTRLPSSTPTQPVVVCAGGFGCTGSTPCPIPCMGWWSPRWVGLYGMVASQVGKAVWDGGGDAPASCPARPCPLPSLCPSLTTPRPGLGNDAIWSMDIPRQHMIKFYPSCCCCCSWVMCMMSISTSPPLATRSSMSQSRNTLRLHSDTSES